MYISLVVRLNTDVCRYQGHAYSVIKAIEVRGKRFLKIRNPWGQSEWTGRWSDGSKEWTKEWLDALDPLEHTFGDDGVFIMEYNDFLTHWEVVEKTQLFDPSWVQSSHWLNVKGRPLPSAWQYGDVSCKFICVAYSTPHLVNDELLDISSHFYPSNFLGSHHRSLSIRHTLLERRRELVQLDF